MYNTIICFKCCSPNWAEINSLLQRQITCFFYFFSNRLLLLFRIMDKRCRRLLWTLSLVWRRWIATWLRFMYWIILQKVYFAKSWSWRFIWSRKLYQVEMLLLRTGQNKETYRICRGTKINNFLRIFQKFFFRNFKKQINSVLNGNKKKIEKQKSENLWKPVLQPCKKQVTS